MAKDCLHCGLQYSDTTNFCPNCGRSTERGFRIRPIQESEFDRLCRAIKEKDDLIRQLLLALTQRRGEGKYEGVSSIGRGKRLHRRRSVLFIR